jgi:type I restriction enzyme S subunit
MQENQELPKGWMSLNLGDVAFVTKLAGFEYTKFVTYTPDGDLAVIKAENVSKQGFKQTNFSYVNADTVKHLVRSVVAPGDLLMSFVGSVGQVARVPEGRQYFLGPNVALIRVLPSFVDERYAEFYLRSPLATETVKATSKSTTQASISMGQIRLLPLVVAPLPEQRRIVAKLEELFSRLDAGVATLRQTQAQLKRYRQSVLHAAVTGELTRAWREAHPAPTETGAALLARIRAERRAQWEAAQVAKRGGQLPLGEGWKKKYEEPAAPDTSELPELPAGWVWAGGEIVADFVDPQPSHRTPPEFENGVSYIGMGDVGKDNRINFDQSRKVHPDVFKEHTDRYVLKTGDFFFGKIGTIGNPVKLPEPFDYTLSANIILVQPHLSIAEGYLFWYMSGPFISGHFKKNSKATTQAAFGIQKARVLPIPLPPLAEQAEIVAEVERRLTVLDVLSRALTDELKRAERLRQSILHRAFTGQLVAQDPSDESAAALLARLHAEAPAAPKARKQREAVPAPAKERKPKGRKPAGGTQIDLSF